MGRVEEGRSDWQGERLMRGVFFMSKFQLHLSKRGTGFGSER